MGKGLDNGVRTADDDEFVCAYVRTYPFGSSAYIRFYFYQKLNRSAGVVI